jgi:hypothetical protein
VSEAVISTIRKAEPPEAFAAWAFAGFSRLRNPHREKAFDHRNDHRQRNSQKTKIK